MSDFVKPKRVVARPEEYIKEIINHGLIKDLCDDEEMCEFCKGTGIVITNNPYGLADDVDKISPMFPYTHQSLSFCPHCYNGVVHRCKLCGKIMPRGRLKCTCEQQRKLDEEERTQKEKLKLEKAELLTGDKLSRIELFYSEYYTQNDGFFEDFDEFFEDWYEQEHYEGRNIPRPEYVWCADKEKMQISAENIVTNALDEMYEDAYYDIDDKKIEELQKYLDDWCENCGVGYSYYKSERTKARIPWENYKE